MKDAARVKAQRIERRARLWQSLFECEVHERAGWWKQLDAEYGMGDAEVLQAFADAFEGASEACGVAAKMRLEGNPNVAEGTDPGHTTYQRKRILESLRSIQCGQGPTATGLVPGMRVKLPASAFEVDKGGRPSQLTDDVIALVASWRESGWLDGPKAVYERLHTEKAIAVRTAREWARVGAEHLVTGNSCSRAARFAHYVNMKAA